MVISGKFTESVVPGESREPANFTVPGRMYDSAIGPTKWMFTVGMFCKQPACSTCIVSVYVVSIDH